MKNAYEMWPENLKGIKPLGRSRVDGKIM